MHGFRHAPLAVCGCLLLGACTRPAPPPDDLLAQGMAEALIDTGFYSEVGISRIIGRHYHPADDRWTIYACYQLTLADGRQGSNCVDSFGAHALHGGGWVVSVSIDDAYRWRAVGLPVPAPRSVPPTGNPPRDE